MTRTPLVAGNWKMHGNRTSNESLLGSLLKEIAGIRDVECAVCVPFPYLAQVSERLRGSPIGWGAQNTSEHAQGPYTGEVSAAMLVEFGCRYAIVGHSERRQLFGESDVQVAAKFAAAQAVGLVPILCVGETLEERDGGRTREVVGRQLDAVIGACGKQSFSRAVVAYEPVWAIGSGRTATPRQVQEVHELVRARILAETRILYGGSVKPQNAAAIFAMPEVDGGLIGGASLDAGQFAAIVKAAEAKGHAAEAKTRAANAKG